jgi:tRNA (guanosine-2'-O-)-methyltransferase
VTPSRFHRLRQVLERRQPDLTVLLEDVHKAHNLSAIIRSSDAAGVFEVHAVASNPLTMSRLRSAGVDKWVKVNCHESVKAAMSTLRNQGMQLLAADPVGEAVDFREVDLTLPTAIIFGQEKDGLTKDALAHVDGLLKIPMMGFVGSLNVSVAAALILFEAQRQRTAAGLYTNSRLDPLVFKKTLFEWAHPKVAGYCQQKGRAYPDLGPDGDLIDFTATN